MSEFMINYVNCRGIVGEIDSYASELARISQKVSSTALKIRGKDNTATNVKKSIKNLSTAISNEQKKMNQLQVAMTNSIQQYIKAESALTGAAVKISKIEQEKNGSKEDSNSKNSLWEWSDTWKMLQQLGILGTGASIIGGLVTGGITTKNILGTGKTTISLIEKISKSISEPSFDWKTLFGLNAAIKEDTPTNFFSALRKETEKLDLSNAENTAGKAATIAKWAGFAMTGIITAYDNFTDKDNTTLGRKVAETVGETAVKIGEGMIISAGVTAGLAALGFVGAPAVVVGGITVAATWGLDKLCEAATGKDVAEFVSDSVLDFGKNVCATVKGIGDSIQSSWLSKNRYAGAW